MIAALPKSTSAVRSPAGCTPTILSSRTVTVPPATGGAVAGKTQWAVRICSSAPGMSDLCLLQSFNRGNQLRIHRSIDGCPVERIVRPDAIDLVIQSDDRGAKAIGI